MGSTSGQRHLLVSTERLDKILDAELSDRPTIDRAIRRWAMLGERHPPEKPTRAARHPTSVTPIVAWHDHYK
jgi:hypothetical protein